MPEGHRAGVARGPEPRPGVRIEDDQIDLALHRLQQLDESLRIFYGVVHTRQHDVLDEDGAAAAPRKALL